MVGFSRQRQMKQICFTSVTAQTSVGAQFAIQARSGDLKVNISWFSSMHPSGSFYTFKLLLISSLFSDSSSSHLNPPPAISSFCCWHDLFPCFFPQLPAFPFRHGRAPAVLTRAVTLKFGSSPCGIEKKVEMLVSPSGDIKSKLDFWRGQTQISADVQYLLNT